MLTARASGSESPVQADSRANQLNLEKIRVYAEEASHKGRQVRKEGEQSFGFEPAVQREPYQSWTTGVPEVNQQSPGGLLKTTLNHGRQR